jgi:hypothetical protein
MPVISHSGHICHIHDYDVCRRTVWGGLMRRARERRLTVARWLRAVCVAAIVALGVASPVLASPVRQTTEVSVDPADWTPRVISASGAYRAVYQLHQIGDTMFAGGNFRQVQPADRSVTLNRKNLFSFSADTGAIKPLSVSMNGNIWAIASHRGSLYVGGTFSTFNGVSRRGLVKINATTGVVDRRFDAHLNGAVRDAEVIHRQLIIGGEFGKHLKAVNLHTGATTPYLQLQVAGDLDGRGGAATRVYRFAVNPQHTRLVAVGNFQTVDGKVRARAFMVDLGSHWGALDPWYYKPLTRRCSSAHWLDYLRAVDFSPNGKWFAVDGTGYVSRQGDLGSTVCDAAARFETGIAHPRKPTWINYTGGDTLQSIAVTDAAVYVQGHNRWLDNKLGRDTCGTGCVSRRGIGAISPTTGLALAWDPTKDLHVGGKDLLLTRAGLWVASDTTTIGNETHERLALMPAS